MAEHRDEQAAATAGYVLGGAEDDVGVHLQRRGDLARSGGGCVKDERGAVLDRGADEDSEREPAPDDHLLDVEDLEVVRGEGPGKGRGHARAVATGERDEERARLLVGVVVHLDAERS